LPLVIGEAEDAVQLEDEWIVFRIQSVGQGGTPILFGGSARISQPSAPNIIVQW
jgi:hypothetical protein